MPLPSSTDLATLDYIYLGAPFVQVEARPISTASLDTAYQGAPFVAVGPIAAAGLNIYVRVTGAWKQASAMFVRVAGSWKNVASVSTRVGGAWRT